MGNTLNLTTPSDREILITREFAATRRLVFEAFVKPNPGPAVAARARRLDDARLRIDFRVGGRYRFVWRKDSDGAEMGMGGVYREIAPPERIVATELFDEAGPAAKR